MPEANRETAAEMVAEAKRSVENLTVDVAADAAFDDGGCKENGERRNHHVVRY